ncbi:hypothetical protein HB779_23400 (plasmid) [Phyllobacterium sp. 628]|uniref:hypothetical protein n=1 Tax=Phyllobacterium sp. 628 TaxID=2718938 RepID=UPI001662458B|nr:hypothetical protein [Phyllobacterium sp. 628]QND54841.1 hypothetical protein HB779_23400 [Phyllobacterium sp. 628]
MRQLYGFKSKRRSKRDAQARIANYNNEILKIAIGFALDHGGSNGLSFLNACRDGDWVKIRREWPEWPLYLLGKFPERCRARRWLPDSNRLGARRKGAMHYVVLQLADNGSVLEQIEDIK